MNNFTGLLDEELLLLSRLGVSSARDTLAERYYKAREYHAKRASPGAYYAQRAYELNQSFYDTFLSACNSFRFGKARFRKYLEVALSHDIYRAGKEASNVLSLNAPLDVEREGYLTFEDVMQASNYEDPKTFLNYAEEAFLLKSAPSYLTKKCLIAARLRIEGKTYAQIGKLLKISERQAKSLFLNFTEFIKDAIKKDELPGLESVLLSNENDLYEA